MVKVWLQSAKDQPGGWTDRGLEGFPDEDVTVDVLNSAVNFKDALAVTGRSPIFRKFPMVPGIDLVGRVVSDRSGALAPGDLVVATGHGLGEAFWGAYAEKARLKPEWAIKLPAGISAEAAAAIGTAGVTAAMAIDRLEDNGVRPEKGPVLVTGAGGGVGGQAVAMLAKAGYRVMVATGRPSEADYLTGLGASEIIDRAELSGDPRPLAKERWQGAVDVAGGTILANILAATQADGAVAACGLAQSANLPSYVAPFILRGVSLLGINSPSAPPRVRERAWARLARDLEPGKLEGMIVRRRFAEIDAVAADLLDEKFRGRVVLGW